MESRDKKNFINNLLSGYTVLKKYLLQLVEYKILTSKNMFSKTTHMSCTGRP